MGQLYDISSKSDQLSTPASTNRSGVTSKLKSFVLFGVALIACARIVNPNLLVWNHHDTADICPQTAPLVPRSESNAVIQEQLGGLYTTDVFKNRAVDWLSGAVQVKTESFDKMAPVGEDPRWEAFGVFHDHLLKAFPNIHATLNLTKVNTYGLLYHWQGTDDGLKPLLLMGHQDVVPVEPITLGQWLHPPYSGHFDGKWIWGRGAGDDKSGVIGIMSAIESLLSTGFKPKRTVVLSFGFDEEASGVHGAQALAKEILKVYGENAFSMLVDEGGGYGEQEGTMFAIPAVAEKGYLDTRITVKTPGGHSSVPPEHTSIGILASLLVQYEKNPIVPALGRSTATYGTIQCIGAHGKTTSRRLKRLITRSSKSNTALRKVEKIVFKNKGLRAQAGTTQAIDLINGGVKVNALPESVDAVVNHRIASDSNVAAVMERDTKLLVPLAISFNLSFTAYGKKIATVEGPTYGTLELSDAWGTLLEPAPKTPVDPNAEPYKLLSGTIISTYEKSSSFNGDPIIVAPGMSTGNTDTRYYWKLTRHIFRYNHHSQAGSYNGAHTVNEAITADSFLEMIKFFTTLILNADEATTI